MTEASGKNQGKNVFCCSYLHIYDYANARPRPYVWLVAAGGGNDGRGP